MMKIIDYLARCISEDPNFFRNPDFDVLYLTCLKAVNPGEWYLSGSTVPGSVIPPKYLKRYLNDIEQWTSSKMTRDIIGTQSLEYLINVPKDAIVEDHGSEWIINSPCEYKLNRIISDIPDNLSNLAILNRSIDVDGMVGGNFVISLDEDIKNQIITLYSYENDEAEVEILSDSLISIYSSNLDEVNEYELFPLLAGGYHDGPLI